MKFVGSKKGISTLIATVIMTALTLTIAAVVIIWAVPYTQTLANIESEQGETQVTCTDAALYFDSDDVGYNNVTNPSIVNITIENSGWVNLYDFTIQLKISGNWSSYEPTSDFTKNSPLNPGEKATLNTSMTQQTGTLQSARVFSGNCKNANKEVSI